VLTLLLNTLEFINYVYYVKDDYFIVVCLFSSSES
jgi:hypothetical protein